MIFIVWGLLFVLTTIILKWVKELFLRLVEIREIRDRIDLIEEELLELEAKSKEGNK